MITEVEKELGSIQGWFRHVGFPYSPESVALPKELTPVEQFIRERANRDLPRQQFEKDFEEKYRSIIYRGHWPEITGVLGFWGGVVREIEYSGPEKSRVLSRLGTISGVISDMGTNKLDLNELLDGDKILTVYHSHPDSRPMSAEDALSYKFLVERASLLRGKGVLRRIYFPIFMPLENQSVWYVMREIPT